MSFLSLTNFSILPFKLWYYSTILLYEVQNIYAVGVIFFNVIFTPL